MHREPSRGEKRGLPRIYLWLLGGVIVVFACVAGLFAAAIALFPGLPQDEEFYESHSASASAPVGVSAPAPVQPPSERARAAVQQLRSTWKGSTAVAEALEELDRALASCGGCETRTSFPGITQAVDRLIQAGAWNELFAFSRLFDSAREASYPNITSYSHNYILELAASQYLRAPKAAAGKRCGAGAQRLQLVEPPLVEGHANFRVLGEADESPAIIWAGDLNADGLPEFLTEDLVVWSGCGGAAFKRYPLPRTSGGVDRVGSEPARGRRGWVLLGGNYYGPDGLTELQLFEFDGRSLRHVGTRQYRDEWLWGVTTDYPPPAELRRREQGG